ncbi:MAG: hypothetical protein ABL932_11095 [Terricaulis sp.]
MHVRKRYAAMLAIAALIVGVVLFQAVTAKPPEPYVALAGRPLAPVLVYGCSARFGQVAIYTTGEGEELDPVPTGHPCGYGDLGPSMPSANLADPR